MLDTRTQAELMRQPLTACPVICSDTSVTGTGIVTLRSCILSTVNLSQEQPAAQSGVLI